MTLSIRESTAQDAPEAPTYAQAMEVRGAERILFVSGQIPVRRDGTVPATFAEQAEVAWSNVLAQLRAARMTVDNLVKVTIFLSDRKYIDEYRRTRDAALGGRRIGLTTIITGIFGEGWLLGIETIPAA